MKDGRIIKCLILNVDDYNISVKIYDKYLAWEFGNNINLRMVRRIETNNNSIKDIVDKIENLANNHSLVAFGLEGGLAVPTGSTSNKYGVGFGAGAFAIITTSSTTVSVVIGADYLNMPGKTKTEYEEGSGPGHISGGITTKTTYYGLQVGSFYAGPKFGKEDGAYFLPAISLNFSSETSFGFYLGGGVLIPLESIKLHLGARYGILNFIGKDKNEDSEGGIAIVVGIVL